MKCEKTERKVDLDAILNEIGYIGWTQSFYILLICFIAFFTGSFTVIYAFTAGDLNYRCYIENCDQTDIKSVDYKPEWIKHGVPFNEDTKLPEKCFMYEFVASDRENKTHEQCDANDFNTQLVLKCDKFVYETEEETILTEFGLTCQENKWKLTMPGTMHSAGQFFNMLMIGYFSDRFGRKKVFIISAILESTFAIAQSLAYNYWWFLTFMFFERALGGGTYTIAIVIGLEYVKPEFRTAVGSIIFAIAALGTVYLGFAAMWLLNWKLLILICYVPNYFIITYIWLIPESIVWLQVKRRYAEIAKILLRIIKWNKLEISAETCDALVNRPEKIFDTNIKPQPDDENKNDGTFPIFDVIRSRPMMFRMVCLAYCWLSSLFIFYGMSLISVAVGENKFTDFIIASAMEIPACGLVTLASNRVGRKTIMYVSFFLSGIALVTYTFVSHIYWFKMMLFMIGKFAITMTVCTIFIHTSEMIPTNLRQTLLGVCAAFGRIGSLTAPQVPLLEVYIKHLPIYTFAGFALIGGIISFQLPETLNCKLPDTIEEALQIGKRDRKKSDVP